MRPANRLVHATDWLRGQPDTASLSIGAGATHRFEEPDALERVAGLARDWFSAHFRHPRGAGGHAQPRR